MASTKKGFPPEMQRDDAEDKKPKAVESTKKRKATTAMKPIPKPSKERASKKNARKKIIAQVNEESEDDSGNNSNTESLTEKATPSSPQKRKVDDLVFEDTPTPIYAWKAEAKRTPTPKPKGPINRLPPSELENEEEEIPNKAKGQKVIVRTPDVTPKSKKQKVENVEAVDNTNVIDVDDIDAASERVHPPPGSEG